MAARRLIFAMLALLVLSSAVAALAPTERTTTSSTTTTLPPQEPTGALIERTINIGEGAPQTIVLRPGDQLVLTVSGARTDEVELRGLGQIEDVDPDADARFNLVPFDPGRFAIRLLEAQETIGTIVVRESGGKGGKQPEQGKKGDERDGAQSS